MQSHLYDHTVTLVDQLTCAWNITKAFDSETVQIIKHLLDQIKIMIVLLAHSLGEWPHLYVHMCVCVYSYRVHKHSSTLRLLGRPQNKRKFTLYGYYFTSWYIRSKNMQYNVHWVYYYHNFVTYISCICTHTHTL